MFALSPLLAGFCKSIFFFSPIKGLYPPAVRVSFLDVRIALSLDLSKWLPDFPRFAEGAFLLEGTHVRKPCCGVKRAHGKGVFSFSEGTFFCPVSILPGLPCEQRKQRILIPVDLRRWSAG